LRVRIPEIHAALPIPSYLPTLQQRGEEYDIDHRIINQYPVFVAQNSKVSGFTPAPGDLVWVDFQNKNSLEGGIYVGPVNQGDAQNPVAGAGVTTMLGNTFEFTMDLTENGDIVDPNERIRYALATDGAGNQFLGRNDFGGLGLQPVAENIDALNFVYLDNTATPTTDPLRVRSVQVTIVARSGRVVPVLFNRHTDNRIYRNQQNQIILPAQNDNFRRMIITSEIKCRNL